MNGYTPFFVSPSNPDFDFFQVLRGYLKFALFVLVFFYLLIALLWHLQPWFEIDLHPKNSTHENSMSTESSLRLQSAVEVINHTVRSGETMSGIADRYKVPLMVLLKQNPTTQPNILWAGQRIKILRPRER